MHISLSLTISALLLSLVTSCHQAEDQHTHQEIEPISHTSAQPDSLPLDSLTSDSVDYNQPESPRM